MNDSSPTFYEFFAGGGMARAGLGAGWRCLFANDFDAMKAATYAENWGQDHFIRGDVAKLRPSDLPGAADLAWASFPCQDLSLAGGYRGLGSATAGVKTRSGTFWPFWELIKSLKAEGRAPRMVVLENVVGVLTSRGGKDFSAICAALADAEYRFGAIVADARDFVPQSRQRVFFIAVARGVAIPRKLEASAAGRKWHPSGLVKAQAATPATARRNWVWWNLRTPAVRSKILADVIEDDPDGVAWHTLEQTAHILRLMSPINHAKLDAAKRAGRTIVGGVYRRTRPDEKGVKRQRAEVRFDDVAGCLRTPSGGSSRQTILVVDGDQVRSRLLSPREAARLMGLDDDYKLPVRYNDAYHVAGDGVCAPVVRHIASSLLEPILAANGIVEELLAAE